MPRGGRRINQRIAYSGEQWQILPTLLGKLEEAAVADEIHRLWPGGNGGTKGPEIQIPEGLGSKIVVGLVVLLVAYAGLSSVYTVDPHEEAVVLRLGKLHGTPRQAGFHFKLPAPIDRVFKVPTKKVKKLEFGYRTEQAGIRTRFRNDPHLARAEALMLTGDLNMATVEWVVQFRISDPVEWLFNIRDPEQTLRDVSESVIRRVVGDTGVDSVLTVGRVQIEADATKIIQETISRYGAGIRVEQVKLQNVKPPEPVQASFNDVNKATQDRQRLENQALAAYNAVVPKAAGEALQRLEAAQGYAVRRTNEAKGDAERYRRVAAEYRKAPDVTRRRLYLEAVEKILPRAGDIVLLDEGTPGILPFLDLKGTGVAR